MSSVTPSILESDLKIYITGGINNTDTNLSLGGPTSTTEFVSGVLDNLFSRVTLDQSNLGITQYRCLTFKNTHTSAKALKARVIIESNSSSNDSEVRIGIGAAGFNEDEILLSSETVKPSNVNFQKIETFPAVANIGDMSAGDRINVWIEWVTDNGAESTDNDEVTLRIDFDQEGQTPPPPPTCDTGEHWDAVLQQCVPDSTPPTCPDGQKYDPVNQICVPEDTPIECPEGSHYDEDLQTCVSDIPPPPPPVDVTGLHIAAVGDFDCKSATDDTFDNIKKNIIVTDGSTTKVGFLLALGDFSYGSSQDCWLTKAKTLGNDVYPNQIFPIIGNHDDSEDGSKQKRTDIINEFPSIESKGYYALTIGPLYIIMMDTQSDYDEGSDQYNFVKAALESASSNPSIYWKIVCYHKPSLAAPGDHHGGLTDFRDAYHPLFDQHKVVMTLAGHNHNYYRSFPLTYKTSSPFYNIVNNTQGPYNNVAATTYIIVGTGGKSLRGNDSGAYVASRHETHGIGLIIVSNEGKKLTWQFIENSDEILDQCEFNKV